MTLKQSELSSFIEVAGQRGENRRDLREIFPKHFGLPSSGVLQHFLKVRDKESTEVESETGEQIKIPQHPKSYHHELESWCLAS